MALLIRNGTLVTGDRLGTIVRGDLLIEKSRISRIGKNLKPKIKHKIIDATDTFVIPGLVQAHIHLCQTLFRGLADDLSLLDWLEKKIWPFEKAHTKKSIQASARVGILDLMLCGTTTIVDMGTVNYTHAMLEAVAETGIRYWGGKCFMDDPQTSGPLHESTARSIAETEDLINEWNHKTELLNYAICPRFVISCTEEMLEYCRDVSHREDLVIHTHASENTGEVELVRKRTGRENIDYLNDLGLLHDKTIVAHGIHVNDGELDHLAHHNCTLVHCPSSNLKLASGIARIEHYLKKGVNVALGADGAPCNNMLDPFMEMRLAALLQKPTFGPEALRAKKAFELATMAGARAVGAADQIGSLEVGKFADIVIVDRSHPSVATVEDPYSALVYSCTGRDVRDVIVNGNIVVKNQMHQLMEADVVIDSAKRELKSLLRRS
jgi:5-methylthioadenosine/S-adenosylhomocysteine deaminase